MIEWIIGGAVALALLTRKKEPAGPGSGSDEFFAEDGFSPDPANPSKVDKGFDIANKTMAAAATAAIAAKKAADEFRKNPTEANKKKLSVATATANRAKAAAARVKKQKPPKPAKPTRAAARVASSAGKAPKLQKHKPAKNLSDKEKKVLDGGLQVFRSKGIPDAEAERIARLPEKAARAELEKKGLTRSEIKIVLTAIKIAQKRAV